MQQTGHGSPAEQHAALGREGWNTEPVMPVVSGEARYEALEIGRKLDDADARQAFWMHLLASGVAGGTYGANGIWQVNRRDQPYGNSPGGNNWGTTPWDDAMRLPGSTQVAHAKRFLESLPWNDLQPLPDTVAWGDVAERSPAERADRVAQACGIGDRLRVCYVPDSRTVVLRALRPQATYRVTLFDPLTGQRQPGGEITAGTDGQWNCKPPPHGHDWVVLLES